MEHLEDILTLDEEQRAVQEAADQLSHALRDAWPSGPASGKARQ